MSLSNLACEADNTTSWNLFSMHSVTIRAMDLDDAAMAGLRNRPPSDDTLDSLREARVLPAGGTI